MMLLEVSAPQDGGRKHGTRRFYRLGQGSDRNLEPSFNPEATHPE
jgi:hypothetical protein